MLVATVDPALQASFVNPNSNQPAPFGGSKPYSGWPNIWVIDVTTNAAPANCWYQSNCGSSSLGTNTTLVYYTAPFDVFLVIMTACASYSSSWWGGNYQPAGYNQSCAGTASYQIINVASPPPPRAPSPNPPPLPPIPPTPPAPPQAPPFAPPAAPLYPPYPMQSPPPAAPFPPARNVFQALKHITLYHGWTPPAFVINFDKKSNVTSPCVTNWYNAVLPVAGGVFGCAAYCTSPSAVTCAAVADA